MKKVFWVIGIFSLVLAGIGRAEIISKSNAWEIKRGAVASGSNGWPTWEVKLVESDGNVPKVTIDGDDPEAGSEARGYILVGQKITIPSPLKRKLGLTFDYQTYCSHGVNCGLVKIVALQVSYWQKLENEPETCINYDPKQEIYGQVVCNAVGDDVLKWQKGTDDGMLTARLLEYSGKEMIFPRKSGHFEELVLG